VAAVVTFALLFVFFFVFGWTENLVNSTALKQAFGYLDVLAPLQDFAKGIVDTRTLVYYLSTTVFFLFLTARALEAKKWR